MEIGMFFYDKENNSFGEILFEDGSIMVAKYYIFNKNENLLSFNGYGPVVDINKVWGKKKILDYFKFEINLKEKELSMKGVTKEEISKNTMNKIEKLLQKNDFLSTEINNIMKHQTQSFTESRKRQIRCILKCINRNNKKIKYFGYNTDVVDKKIIAIQKSIENKKQLIEIVKKM